MVKDVEIEWVCKFRNIVVLFIEVKDINIFDLIILFFGMCLGKIYVNVYRVFEVVFFIID